MKFLWAAAAIMALGLAGVTVWAVQSKARLAAKLAASEASLAAVIEQRNDLIRSNRIAAANAAKWRRRSEKLDGAVERILTGGIEDAPLDPDLADFLNGLRRAED